MTLHLIAAKSRNNVIGNGPDIPWQAKGEQKLFRDITTGGTLIMGRKTFASIGKPLPGRDTVIITRDRNYTQPDCSVANSLEMALNTATQLRSPAFIAGGGEIYAQALPFCSDLHLTTIHLDCEGDVIFPEYAEADFELLDEQHFSTNVDYTYQHWKRK
ncbi:MAG: dihydrofolate reductase [Pseudomonadales bacterium]